MAYDYETGTEIRVNHEKIQNGLNHTTAGGVGAGGTGAGGNIGEATPAKGAVPELKLSSMDKPMLNALLSKQLGGGKPITAGLDSKKHLPTSTSTAAVGGVVPSLLAAHRKGVIGQKGIGVSGGSISAPGIVPSLKNIQENGSLSGGKSKGNITSNIVLTFPSMASASTFKAKQGNMVATAVVSAATASQRQNVKGSSLVVTAANGPPTSVSSGRFVSESDLRLQEEKVKLLRKQLMAAQSTV